jgi:hypothetical protein
VAIMEQFAMVLSEEIQPVSAKAQRKVGTTPPLHHSTLHHACKDKVRQTT